MIVKSLWTFVWSSIVCRYCVDNILSPGDSCQCRTLRHPTRTRALQLAVTDEGRKTKPVSNHDDGMSCVCSRSVCGQTMAMLWGWYQWWILPDWVLTLHTTMTPLAEFPTALWETGELKNTESHALDFDNFWIYTALKLWCLGLDVPKTTREKK